MHWRIVVIIPVTLLSAFGAKNGCSHLEDKIASESVYHTVYYSEFGDTLFMQNNIARDSAYVVRTRRTKSDIYKDDVPDFKNNPTIAAVSSISDKNWKKVTDLIRDGNINQYVKDHIVPIETKTVLINMFDQIKDGKEGNIESDSCNFREYGGYLNYSRTIIYQAKSLPLSPCLKEEIKIDLGDKVNGRKVEFHSHPSGYIGDMTEKSPTPGSEITIGNGSDKCLFVQGPSGIDQRGLASIPKDGSRRITWVGYVFGMRSNIIYVYTFDEGVVATLFLDKFCKKKITD